MPEVVACGAINWDVNLFVERLPRPGEEVEVRGIQRVSGGTAANVAVAAARILGPGRSAFVGALGSDEIAARQRAILRDEGVDGSGVLTVGDGESGQAYISVGPDGENEIHTFFGANLRLTPGCLADPERRGIISGAKVCVVMDPPLDTAERLSALCKRSGAVVVWDPGVYAARGLDALESTLRNVDYFVLNHHEWENLLGTSDPGEVAARMTARARGLRCIIKHGAEGCALTGGHPGEVLHIDAVPLGRLGLTVANTVGCGDAFIGGFAAGKLEGLGDAEALRWANAAGSFKATRMETRGGPTRAELNDILRRWGKI